MSFAIAVKSILKSIYACGNMIIIYAKSSFLRELQNLRITRPGETAVTVYS